MTIADKYMAEANRKFKFTPPQFNQNFAYNMRVSGAGKLEELFPDETQSNEMFSYYNELKDNNKETNTKTRVLDSDALKDFNIEFDSELDKSEFRSEDKIDKIYKNIYENNYNVFEGLEDNNIPKSVISVIAKRIVRLSLKYDKEID